MRNFDPNDRFHLWKKHSGFKKGLATDIIFGDVRKWNGPVQYSTTMCTDYDAQKNMFHQNPKALEEYNRQQRAHLDASVFVPQSTAGKPLGLLGKKTENHISFGDYSMKNDSRMQSLTASDFKPHSLGDSLAQRKDNKDLSPIERHHSKALTATSSAHIGLQTKQDLPVDDKFFKCFVTSNADAYVNQFPAHQRALEKEAHNTLPKNSGRMSNIQQGDLNHYTDYTTMHDSSFVPHHPEDYMRLPAKGPKTQTSIVFGHTHPSGDPSMYVSTSAAAHQVPMNKDLTPKFDASKVRGRSCIVFGDPDKVNGSPSVSQRDYHSYGTDCLLDNLHSKRHDTHVSSITSALAPDGRNSLRDMGSCTALSYRAPGVGNRDERAAGIECGRHKGKQSNISSIPTGDALMFPLGSSYTTTELDFVEHPRTHPVEHPVLGAKMTQSTVSFEEQGGAMDMSNDERYTTTSHSAFVPHPESVAALGRGVSVKPRVALETEDANWSSYPMSQNKTTHTDHYKTPGPSERAHGVKGKLVPRKMLFPLRNHRSFATVTAESFAMRAGLQFDTKDLRAKKAEEEAVRKFRTKSSIAFGDASRPVAPVLN